MIRYGLSHCVPVARVILLAGLMVTPAQAQPAVTGYVKELVLGSRSVLSGDAYRLSLTRLRLQGRVEPVARWHVEAWADAEWRAGSFLETPEYRLAAATHVEPVAALSASHAFSDRREGRIRLYRVTVSREGRRVRLVAGRQRIPWGTAFIWNPTDLFNPTAPASLERDEQPAIDAIRMSVSTGMLTGIDLVAAPQQHVNDGRYAIRYRAHAGEFDLSGMGGWFAGHWVAGGDAAGYIRNAGVRAEATLDDSRQLRATVNADYTFRDGTWTVLEAHYNGGSDLSFQRDRWYMAITASRPMHALVTVSGLVLQNLEDGSGLAGPGIQVSATRSLDVGASAYIPWGNGLSEYGRAHTAVFGTLQLWF